MDQRGYLVESAATKTCTWLLSHEKYAAWLAQPHKLLWIVGKPGAGKSTLIRYALQNLSFNNDVVTSFFFYGRGSDLQRSACGMLRSLLHQLLDHTPELLSKFTLIFKKKRETKQNSKSDYAWHETELREFLQDWILSASRDRAIRIYLDALDEAGQEVAVKLVAYFEELIERLHPTSPGLRICFSCRHYPVLAPKHALKVCVEDENHHDIETYVRQKMTRYQLSDQEESRKLEQEIIEKSCCVFQWVVLIIEIIIQSDKDGASVPKIRQRIKEIPGKLSDLYKHILSNIKEPKRAVQLMQWICFAMEPLSLEYLRYAMVVDITKDFKSLKECQSSVDFADTDEQMRKTVNSLSGGLAEIVEYESRQYVRFIHQSVNDYLIESGLQSLDPSFVSDVNDYLSRSKLPTLERSLSDDVVGLAHFRISRSCVKYINLEGVLEYIRETSRLFTYYDRELRKEELNHRLPFLRYCANWAWHAEIAEKQRMPQADLISLFRWPSEDTIRSWAVVFFDHLVPIDSQNGTLLLFASQHGLSSVIEAMIDSGVSVDFETRYNWGWTPLMTAVSKGHEAVARLLIERRCIIDSRNKMGQTSLSWAVEWGHEAIVRLLIKRDVEINSRDNDGRTPLSRAACLGHEAVVRLL
ncbi:putative Pfs NB-ARC and ankyrin-domain-containing protein, partial [Usnea florida]